MKRYRIDFSYGRYFFDPRDDGDWVRYADHQAELERLRAALQRIKDIGDDPDNQPPCLEHQIAAEALRSA